MRDRVGALPVLLLVLAGATACAPGQRESGGAARKLPATVAVEHRFGTTTIDRVPQRVVALDRQWTDVMLSLGVRPVGCGVDERRNRPAVRTRS